MKQIEWHSIKLFQFTQVELKLIGLLLVRRLTLTHLNFQELLKSNNLLNKRDNEIKQKETDNDKFINT